MEELRASMPQTPIKDEKSPPASLPPQSRGTEGESDKKEPKKEERKEEVVQAV
jgi:hypothetical protein